MLIILAAFSPYRMELLNYNIYSFRLHFLFDAVRISITDLFPNLFFLNYSLFRSATSLVSIILYLVKGTIFSTHILRLTIYFKNLQYRPLTCEKNRKCRWSVTREDYPDSHVVSLRKCPRFDIRRKNLIKLSV